MSNNKDTNFISHFLNVSAGTIINALLGLISTPLITRIVDPSEYGKLSIFNAYADITLAFVFIGLDKGLVRFFYDKDDNKDQRSLLKLCFIVPIVTGIIISIIYLLIIKIGVINNQFNYYILFLLCVYVLVCIWNRLSLLLLRLTYKTKEYSSIVVIQKIVYVLIIVLYVLLIKHNYLLMLVLSLILSTFVGGVVGQIYTKNYWKLSDVKIPDNKGEILKYSIPFILYSAMDALSSSMDKLSIYAYLDDYETGIYSSALAIVAIVLMVRTIFETVWTPMQTEHFVKNPNDKEFIQKGNRYITIIMYFLCIHTILFKDILCYLLGSSYRGAAKIIPFLILGNSLFAISDTTTSGIDYSKRSYLHSIIAAIVLVANFTGNILLVPRIGSIGAAIATCVSYIAYLLLRIYFSNKYYFIDYGVNKIVIMMALLLVFSYLNTYFGFSIYAIIEYLIVMIIFITLYLEDIKEMVAYFKGSLLNK